MAYTIVTPAATEPVSVAEAKLHLRIDHDDEDSAIAGFIKAAVEAIETRLAIAMMTRRILMRAMLGVGGEIALPIGPIASINAVRIGPRGAAAQIVDANRYRTGMAQRRSHIEWIGAGAPTGEEIEIDYHAGFGEAATSIPPDLRQAVLVLCGHFYAEREAGGAWPESVVAGLARFRERRL